MTDIRLLESAADAAPLLRILRNTLDDTAFAERLNAAEAQGYKVIAAFEGDDMVGALGYRITNDLCWGQTLFIDDLVVNPAQRSAGIGAALLAEARSLAANGCDHVRLCSGVNRTEAHRFYKTNGMTKFSYQFVEALKG
ncbi:MAG: GNAT family N-acetyltransferase [Dinoroseobacter sp.]|nr:GNAT family N-acetyltransferase [Dinoroseobacter sp.]